MVHLSSTEGFEGDCTPIVSVAILDALAAIKGAAATGAATKPATATATANAPAVASALTAVAPVVPLAAGKLAVCVELGVLKQANAVTKQQEVASMWVEVDVPGMEALFNFQFSERICRVFGTRLESSQNIEDIRQ